MRSFFIIIFSLVMSGCAIKQLAPEDARGIPENRVMQKELLKQSSNMVEIRFIREEAIITGTGASANLYLNNRPLAALWTGEKFSIWVKPELYVIGLTASERWVSNEIAFSRPDSARHKLEIDAKIGRRYDVRVDLANWTGVMLQASSSKIDP